MVTVFDNRLKSPFKIAIYSNRLYSPLKPLFWSPFIAIDIVIVIATAMLSILKSFHSCIVTDLERNQLKSSQLTGNIKAFNNLLDNFVACNCGLRGCSKVTLFHGPNRRIFIFPDHDMLQANFWSRCIHVRQVGSKSLMLVTSCLSLISRCILYYKER